MTCNTGKTQRIVRIVFGMTLVTLAATRVLDPIAWLGVIPLLSGLVGWCPFSSFNGGSCKVK